MQILQLYTCHTAPCCSDSFSERPPNASSAGGRTCSVAPAHLLFTGSGVTPSVPTPCGTLSEVAILRES